MGALGLASVWHRGVEQTLGQVWEKHGQVWKKQRYYHQGVLYGWLGRMPHVSYRFMPHDAYRFMPQATCHMLVTHTLQLLADTHIPHCI